MVLLITAASVINLAQPFLVRGVIDVSLPHQDLSLLVWLTAGMVALSPQLSLTSLIGSQPAGRWRMATLQIVFAAIPAVIYLAAGLPATSQGMTIGTLVAFTALQGQVFRPVMGLLNIGVQWVTALAFFSRIFKYLDLEPAITPPTHPALWESERVQGEIRFEQVGFSDDDGSPTLAGIDLVVPAGTTTAVVGCLRENLLLARPETRDSELWAALDELSSGRTTLMIAHRLPTVMDADQVIVLERGRIRGAWRPVGAPHRRRPVRLPGRPPGRRPGGLTEMNCAC